jgi:hypothetical protein
MKKSVSDNETLLACKGIFIIQAQMRIHASIKTSCPSGLPNKTPIMYGESVFFFKI